MYGTRTRITLEVVLEGDRKDIVQAITDIQGFALGYSEMAEDADIEVIAATIGELGENSEYRWTN